MPWVDEDKCVGCEVCVKNCPVDAISMKNEKAKIDMDKCIHCGICHSVCPEEAVRHDSEKVPELIEANVEMTERFMDLCAKYLGDIKEKQKCLNRMMAHFNKEKIVAEKTLAQLEEVKKNLAKEK